MPPEQLKTPQQIREDQRVMENILNDVFKFPVRDTYGNDLRDQGDVR